MIVQKGLSSDRGALVGILNEIISIGGTTAFEIPLKVAFFDRFINPPSSKTFLHVADVDGDVVGFQWMEPLAPPHSHIGGIATFARRDTTQRGVGSALFERTRASSHDAGYTCLDATIREDNTGGLAFYTKLGFLDHSVTHAVPLNDGTPIDRIHKRMKL